MHFEGRRPCLVALAEPLVPDAQGFGFFGEPKEGAQDVDGFELVGDFASGGQLELAFLELLEGVGELSVVVAIKKRQRLQNKRSVVSDVVDDGQALFALGESEASAELLGPQDSGLGGAEHHDRVEGGEVDAFVEGIDGEDDVELAIA